jgi:hypothetical protein
MTIYLDLEQSYLGSDCVTDPPKWCQLSISLGCSTPQESSSLSHLRLPWLEFPTPCQLTLSPCKVVAFRLQFSRPQYMVHCLIVQTHMGLSAITIRTRWFLRHKWFAIILVYHADDDSVGVKAPKPWHKWYQRPNRVRIFSHITTIPATLLTFQQPYSKEKIRGTNRCMPLYTIFHSITRQLISPFVAPVLSSIFKNSKFFWHF